MKNAYLESWKHYNATVNRKRREALCSAPTEALGIRALFNTVLDCLDDPHTPSPVCLMAGALTTEVLAEPDLRKYVQEQVSALAEVMIERMLPDKSRAFTGGIRATGCRAGDYHLFARHLASGLDFLRS
jgi:TetR/AcrR family transcriptional repressor of nem operon